MTATGFQLSIKFANTNVYSALGVEGIGFFVAFNMPSTAFNKTYLQHYFNGLLIVFQLIKSLLNVEGRVCYKF